MTHSNKFDVKYLKRNNYKPSNILIFQTAANMAAVAFEAMLSAGLDRGQYVGRGDKPVKMYVAKHLEKFIPMAISTLIDMLKPTSNCTNHMREEIHKALTDPLNDPGLMKLGEKKQPVNSTDQMLLNAIRNFDKNKIKDIINAPVAAAPVKKKNLKSSTSLN